MLHSFEKEIIPSVPTNHLEKSNNLFCPVGEMSVMQTGASPFEGFSV